MNKARWKDSDLHALEVHVLHRGAPGDRRVISGSRIRDITASGIDLIYEHELSDSVHIPYHRFLAVVGADGAELWSKDGGAASESAAHDAPAEEPLAVPAVEIVPEIQVVLRAEPGEKGLLVIDGSAGEGGGQLLRTSLALSIITGRPFSLERIRAGRKKPGLMRQHLTCVKAAALICNAEVEGATVGSTEITFRPGPVTGGIHHLDIGSAGSVSLVLQTIAFPLMHAREAAEIKVRGGTHALWAPPYPFLEVSWLPLVQRAGGRIALELKSAGFYPAGGGEVVLKTEPTDEWKALHLGAPSVLAPLDLTAIVSQLSEGIARRELAAAAELLADSKVTLSSAMVKSPGPGNAMWLVARDEVTNIANVFSGIGDPGVKAEDIGESVAKSFLAWRASGTSVEEHLADQVMLPIVMSGAGSYTTNVLSLHSKTNLEVIHAFTEKRFRCFQIADDQVRITLG